ncbi:MAG: CehA/McbA family metallohydrolase, partial [Actinobacteria bacterium]|nr:CehA/McbA family metallohydrolase [Actinomycetota bacterium]
NVLITPEASTTVGFLPGRIPRGAWAAEIGVAAVTGPTEGNASSVVNWRLEIFTSRLASDLDTPWRAAKYDAKPANPNPGWYSGDMHVHAEHSSPNDATMVETFDYAFNKAGLDFVTLSDYVTSRHWGEIGRLQGTAVFPKNKLVVRSAEIITYRGHVNNHATARYVDYRTGPIYLRAPGGALTKIRDAQPAARIFADIHRVKNADGSRRGWSQVNHPTIFPSQVPAFGNFCRGCSWAYSDAETDWPAVDAFEVQTGPSGTAGPEGDELGPNPFTVLAIGMYDHLRRMGFDITAVGSSDSHLAGRTSPISTPAGTIPLALNSPVGEGTTVVYARELSESGIRDGILAGHAYVKFFAPDGPDLRFSAVAEGAPEVMMGDEIAAPQATFTASVLHAKPSNQPRVLLVLLNGVPILAYPVTGEQTTVTFPAVVPGDYRIQLMRGTAYEAMTNPITLAAP